MVLIAFTACAVMSGAGCSSEKRVVDPREANPSRPVEAWFQDDWTGLHAQRPKRFQEAMASWNIPPSEGELRGRVEAVVFIAPEPEMESPELVYVDASPWLYLGSFGNGDLDMPRVTEWQGVKVDAGVIRSERDLSGIMFRTLQAGGDPPESLSVVKTTHREDGSFENYIALHVVRDPLESQHPSFFVPEGVAVASYSEFGAPVGYQVWRDSRSVPRAGLHVLDVPFRSGQNVGLERAECLCVPACVAMVLSSFGNDVSTREVAERAHDGANDVYDNWSRNVQAARELGMRGRVVRISSWDEVETLIAQGVPIIASIDTRDGELRNAPPGAADKRPIVIRGFDAEGDVLISDPAAPAAESGELVYSREGLTNAWLERTHGTACVLGEAFWSAYDEEFWNPPPAPIKLEVIGRLGPGARNEISGIVRSRRDPSVFWTQNDSGNEARIYPIRADGTLIRSEHGSGTRGVLIDGAINVDWEDIAIDGSGRIIVADIGNNTNARADLTLYFVEEPDAAADRAVASEKVSYIYPDQPMRPAPKDDFNYDAEALFTVGDGVFVFTKHRSDTRTKLYQLTTRATHRLNMLTLVGSFEARGRVTAADCTPDGLSLVVLTYGRIWLFERDSLDTAWFDGRAYCREYEIANGWSNGEAVCFESDATLLIADEARGKLYRVKIDDVRAHPVSRDALLALVGDRAVR
ncbi:MAG: C39 family peptidase [Phycisphaerales bacterium]|nr:C39 family peptidase [Phycisphaerales bacterium]